MSYLGKIIIARPNDSTEPLRTFIVVYQSDRELGLVRATGGIESAEIVVAVPSEWRIVGHYESDDLIHRVLDNLSALSQSAVSFTDVGRQSLFNAREYLIGILEHKVKEQVNHARSQSDLDREAYFAELRGESRGESPSTSGVQIIVVGGSTDEANEMIERIREALGGGGDV